jgi:hypothetical protein
MVMLGHVMVMTVHDDVADIFVIVVVTPSPTHNVYKVHIYEEYA